MTRKKAMVPGPGPRNVKPTHYIVEAVYAMDDGQHRLFLKMPRKAADGKPCEVANALSATTFKNKKKAREAMEAFYGREDVLIEDTPRVSIVPVY